MPETAQPKLPLAWTQAKREIIASRQQLPIEARDSNRIGYCRTRRDVFQHVHELLLAQQIELHPHAFLQLLKAWSRTVSWSIIDNIRVDMGHTLIIGAAEYMSS